MTTKQQYEQYKQIIENAPEGATHVDNVPTYYMMDSHGREWGVFNGVWCVCVGCNTMRMPPSITMIDSLKQIVSLYEQNERLKSAICCISKWETATENDIKTFTEVVQELNND